MEDYKKVLEERKKELKKIKEENKNTFYFNKEDLTKIPKEAHIQVERRLRSGRHTLPIVNFTSLPPFASSVLLISPLAN